MPVAEQRGAHMERSRQRSSLNMRAPAWPIEHFDFEIPMENELPASADLIQEIERLAIAAHQDMLSVVHEIAGLLIDERVGAAAEGGLAFEHGYTETTRSKRYACRQTGETSTDHDNVFGFDRHWSLNRRGRGARARPRAADEVELARRREAMAAIEHSVIGTHNPF